MTDEGETGRSPASILRVVTVPPEDDSLLAASLDRPTARGDEAGNSYAIPFEGWILGRRSPARSVRLVHDGSLFLELPLDMSRPDVARAHPDAPRAESSGFHGWIGTLGLPTTFELAVKARLEDDTRVTFATISGRRQPVHSDYEPRFKPLLVTTIGRTGSNLLLEQLSTHPEVIAYRPFEYEPYVASYWLSVFQELAEPASYLRQIVGKDLTHRGWWLGTQEHHPHTPVERRVHEWIGFCAVHEIAAFAQRRIDRFYEELSASEDRGNATYFAEKSVPYHLPRLAWELYADMREVILVRDFRDMVASIFAFNRKWDSRAFGRSEDTDDRQHVKALTGITNSLVRSWRERLERAHLVRYEDLVLEPEETIVRLLEYLELDSSPALRRRIGAAAAKRTAHGTSASPEASIGRWRRELPPQLQEDCEEAFGEAMELFGYSDSTRPTATRSSSG